MNCQQILDVATNHLKTIPGHAFDAIELSKPHSPESAAELAKVVSKLSPFLGNLMEIRLVEVLNELAELRPFGEWDRQDPGFPDVVFRGPTPTPGFEVKAWFPLATEITGRFKDSQNHFLADNTRVAIFAWLPEKLVWGRPYILDACVVSGLSVAQARDAHYHDPPDYLVVEPGDTQKRTRNLQQTNTAGFKFQGSTAELAQAAADVAKWGTQGRAYSPTPAYQDQVRELMGRYKYRGDTNFAKMDRVVHAEIEAFKSKVHRMTVKGKTVRDWMRALSADEKAVEAALTPLL